MIVILSLYDFKEDIISAYLYNDEESAERGLTEWLARHGIHDRESNDAIARFTWSVQEAQLPYNVKLIPNRIREQKFHIATSPKFGSLHSGLHCGKDIMSIAHAIQEDDPRVSHSETCKHCVIMLKKRTSSNKKELERVSGARNKGQDTRRFD